MSCANACVETAAHAAAIQRVGVDRGVLPGVGSSRRRGIKLRLIEADVMAGNVSELVGIELELARNDVAGARLRSRALIISTCLACPLG